MHQLGRIELFVENKGDADRNKKSELQHIENAESLLPIDECPKYPSERKLFKTV